MPMASYGQAQQEEDEAANRQQKADSSKSTK